jgi:hypothetical protein
MCFDASVDKWLQSRVGSNNFHGIGVGWRSANFGRWLCMGLEWALKR